MLQAYRMTTMVLTRFVFIGSLLNCMMM